MTTIDQCRRSLQAYKGHITRAVNSCTSVISSTTIDIDRLETSIAFLESKWPGYEQAYMKLESAMLTSEGEDVTSSQEDYYKVWEEYQNNLVSFKSKLREIKVTSTNSETTQNKLVHSTNKPKLPSIKLPTFSGDYTEFEAFYDQFQAQVGSRSDIEAVTKLQYLKSQLRGNALDLIKDIPSVAENYEHSMNSLKQNYGDDEKIKVSLLNKILELKAPAHTRKDLESFRISLVNLTRSLKNKHDFSCCEWIIASLFQRKLSSTTIRQLYLKYNANYFNLTQMTDGLRDLVSHMEVEDDHKPKPKPKQEASKLGNEYNGSQPNTKDIGSYFTKGKPTKQTSQYLAKPKMKYNCVFCNEQHYAYDCGNYTTLSMKQARLVERGRCPRCISAKHKLHECRTDLHTCKRCERGKHHTALCVRSPTEKKPEETKGETTQQAVLSVNSPAMTKSTALPTATVEVCNSNSPQRVVTRAFFDQGSQCTFITKGLVEELKLKITGTTRLAISGFLHSKDYDDYQVVRPLVRLGKRIKKITAVVVDHLPDKISVPGLMRASETLRKANLTLADKLLDGDVIREINLVIGSDFYGDFITGLTSKDQIKLCKSSGGYLIYGNLPRGENSGVEVAQNVVVARICADVAPTEIKDAVSEANIPIHKLWDLDTIGINVNKPAPEDSLSYQTYLDTVKYEDGQYWVRLPWKINCPSIPTNFNMALGQLKSLTTTLETRGELELYNEQIQAQLDNNFIEVIPQALPTDKCHYLPHHAVKKESLTTPIRIVFNCSAKKSNNPSLNDCLMTGPSLTEKLGDMLLKFRINAFAFTADISKAFLRVGLQECDRDYTRFLWYKDSKRGDKTLVTYRFKSVLFGASCSPFLLQATLDTHLKRSDNIYSDLLRQSFYVDNFQGTTNDQNQLVKIYDNANLELSKANMPLRMWVSNNPLFNAEIERDFPDYKVPTSTNILGLCWDNQNDHLSVKSPVFVDPRSLSRRNLLSMVSSVFDPLGLFSPITIKGKLLVREAWKLEMGWDEGLPSTFYEQWSRLKEELTEISNYKLPRRIDQGIGNHSLHVFCDSSTQAYGAVAYLVSNHISCLITSKARVSPIRERTVPQMELTALQVGTHLANYIVKTLSTLQIKEVHVWSDNEAALYWIEGDHSKIPYVRNRVADIKELSSNFHFRHVPTKQNPADLLSRGSSWKYLKDCDLWFSGPSWLCHPNDWPKPKQNLNISALVIKSNLARTPLFEARSISSLKRILNITRIVFAFVKNLKPAVELPTPMHYWLKIIQEEYFKEECEYLASNQSSKPPSLVKNLGLHIDEGGRLIRCGGRLHNSDLTMRAKFPVLIPRKSWLTSLIVRMFHEQVLHGGVTDTLAALREHYWIPKGRQVVKNLLKGCIACKTIEGKAMKLPGPPPLPKERVIHAAPFQTTGIDYSGALTITNPDDNVARKFYICLFTCATTRAVHLELARDMSALTFLNLFRRFVARRSSPTTIISDNGTNFTHTSKFLRELYDDPLVKSHFNDHQIQWKFIPPRSPWMGGFYERLIGIVKTCIRKVLFKRRITEDELITVLTEVEMRVNNRPLTYISDDINDIAPLSPSHLLCGRRLDSMPVDLEDKVEDPDYIDSGVLRQRYEYLCRIMKHWETVWKKEYLSSLREKFYGAQEPNQEVKVKVGDVVLVQNEGSRTSWPLGRITRLHPDKTGIIRVVEVRSRGTLSLRTINKLIPLELSCDPEESDANDEPTSTLLERPKREAAKAADLALKELGAKGLV